MSKSRTNSASKKSLKPTKIVSDSGSTNQSGMKTSEIRDLIDFISKSGLNEVNIETSELKLQVKRQPDQKVFKSTPVVAPVAAPVVTPPTAPSVAGPVSSAPKTSSESSAKKMLEVKSPMIGTFYRSSSPDTAPFASVGDKVTKGQTVCIIEAMKLFNEIESEVSGTIVKVLVENATPVEYDQVLFLVEPD
jgi:acetyl-CoA carboxylase biotin carboxyl carrier protein